MDLELLRTFLELNRTRHFGRSAEALHVTQAAVSSRLQSLEEKLGVTLFERNKREMRLTPEGARLIPHAERQIAGWRAARQDVGSRDGSAQLVIGGSLRLWDVLIQRWMHDIRRAYPNMALIAESQSPDVLTRQLIDGRMDVAIMLEPAQLETMHVTEVASLSFICVTSRKNLAIDDAFGPDYVYVDWGLTFGLDHRRAFPDAPESITRVSHAKIALEYINTVGGTAYLPLKMVEKDIEFGLLHRVADAPVFTRQAYATYPVRSSRMDLIQKCLTLV
ncbi:MAG: LysR family transcriptional regulator [Gammaproteobacteria bacterium]|nr:LysR family transcriptional regulator [Gammaproteobacteria bacterium]